MYVLPGWDKPLVEAISSRKDNLFFYSATLMQPGPFWDNSIIKEANFGDCLENFDEKSLLEKYLQFNHNDWYGATWPPNVVHKDIWHLVGGYSAEFSPGMYSDPDFSMKLWRLGIRDFRGFAESKVYHFESKSTKKIRKNKGSKQFLNKWGITANSFGKLFLKRGKNYEGPLKTPQKTLYYLYLNILSSLKRIIS